MIFQSQISKILNGKGHFLQLIVPDMIVPDIKGQCLQLLGQTVINI